MKRVLPNAPFIAIAAALLCLALPAHAQTTRGDFFIVNGTVNAELLSNDTLYVGGSFTSIGAPTGSGVPLDAGTGSVVPGYPRVSGGQVLASIPDGSGGWFIGGTFTQVGGLPRTNLAHVKPDLSVDSWNPGANDAVRALARSGGTLYAAGSFTTAGGQSRNRIAAIDIATGAATAWNPNASGQVNVLTLDGGIVYAGGVFTAIGGQPRNRIAALDAGTGLATAWNANANSTVNAIVVDGGVVFAGGSFTSIGGQPRNRAAAIDPGTGLASTWNPNANSTVSALAVHNGIVYLGGNFLTVSSIIRNRLAAVDEESGGLTAWNPMASAQVLCLTAIDGIVYAGGDFSSAGMATRSRLAAIDAVTGFATAWNPSAFSTVNTIAADGATVYVGGAFNAVGGQVRNNLAALDVHSGQALAWDPNADGAVQALAQSGGAIVAGGQFDNAGGQPRANLAALDPATGLATAWNPAPDGQVSALTVNASTVYVGGLFTTLGGQSRANLGAVDAATGSATSWNPGTDDQVFALAVRNGSVLAGGQFTTLGGQSRSRVGAVSAATGIATPWNPNLNGTVRSITTSCDRIVIGGFFTMVGATIRNYVAMVDPATGSATSWNPIPNGPAFVTVLHGPALYVGGVMSLIGGQPRNRIAALSVTTANATAWNPNSDGVVRALAMSDTTVYPGGSFGNMGGLGQSGIAAVTADGNLTCPAIVLSPATAPDGRVGTSYSVPFSATGGSGSYCWAFGGALPNGLAFDANTATVSGTPADTGLFVFTLQATDAAGCAGTASYTLRVRPACPAMAIGPAALDTGRVAVAYAETLSVSAGVAPFAWSVTSGTLPAGLTLGAANGVLSGTPTTAGTASFTVRVVDALLCETTRAFSLIVRPACPAIAVTPAVLPNGVVGTGYAQTLGAPAATPPLAWSVASGGLPAGLTLNPATGALSGTPTAVGQSTFSVSVRDSNGCTGDRSYTVTIFASPPTSVVRPRTGGLSISAAHPCAHVPVVFERTDATPTLGISVTFQLDLARIALCTPAHPESSVTAGSWLGADPYLLQVVDQGGGVYTVDQVVLGTCGPTGGGDLFTLDVSAVAGDGAGAITVLAINARDCSNAPIPVAPGAPGSLVICNAPLAFGPSSLPDGSVSTPYTATLTGLTGTAPYTWAVTSGTLPAGLALASATGELTGTPTTAGTSTFTVGMTDTNGCGADRGYTVTVLAGPPASVVAANVQGLCLSPAHPCVSVPLMLARAESTPALGISVTFRVDTTKVALCGTPAASIHQGSWLAAYTTQFQVSADGGGFYTVDQVILGQPCGATTGGTLFSVDLHAVGGDGAGAITVTAVHARDCSNASIPVGPGAVAQISIDGTPPAPVADLAAATQPAGNGADSTLAITVTYTAPPGTVALYRAPFGAYPLYDRDGPVSAPDPSAAPGGPWQLVTASATPGWVDHAPRGVWYYAALVTDSCGMTSAASNATAGALDYLLGDVSDGVVTGRGNNKVLSEDISLLGAHYGITGATIDAQHVAFLDVGPTIDASPTSRPKPDHAIDIEDLAIFSINYGQSAQVPALATSTAARPAGRRAARAAVTAVESFSVTAPGGVAAAGDTVVAIVHMSGGGTIQAFSARLAWNASVVQPVAVVTGALIPAQGGIVLAPQPGTVDAALLGVGAQGMTGAGEIARVKFVALQSGACAITIHQVIARDATNHDVAVQIESTVGVADLPIEAGMTAPSPNPLRGSSVIGFSLAAGSHVSLAVFDASGRRVRSLAGSRFEPGAYRIPWDGRDEAGHTVAAGVYYVRFDAAGRHWTRSLVVMR